jgi:hypothetical protein
VLLLMRLVVSNTCESEIYNCCNYEQDADNHWNESLLVSAYAFHSPRVHQMWR